MFNTNTTFIIGLIVIVVFALITMVNPKENFNVKCEFIPWGPSKRACMDRCRNDRKLWGGQACSKSACYGLCESCSDVKKCNWLDRRDTLTDPNVNVDPALATSTDKPLIIRGIEGDTKCVIQWFHDEKYDSYILKYYMSSRPSEGVKVFNLKTFEDGLNTKVLENLENDIEYSFVMIPVKDSKPQVLSNVLRMVPSPKLNVSLYDEQNPPQPSQRNYIYGLNSIYNRNNTQYGKFYRESYNSLYGLYGVYNRVMRHFVN